LGAEQPTCRLARDGADSQSRETVECRATRAVAGMRVLMVSIIDPSAQMGGAWTVTRAILGLLRSAPLKAEVEVVAVPQRSRIAHRFRQGAAVGQALISGLPSKVEFSRSRAFLKQVRDLFRQSFDMIVINGTDLLWLLPHLPPAMKRLVIAHNIEHQLFAAQIDLSLHEGLAKRLLLRDLAKLRRFEVEGLSRAGNVIFLSSLDAEYARANCPGVRSIVVPPLFGNPPLQRPPGLRAAGTLHIGMLANFGWWPNREGLKWFVEKVVPHISPAVQLHVFGAESERVAPVHPRIQRHGYAASLSDVWSSCDIMIAPISREAESQ
jgi:hypothetical protein